MTANGPVLIAFDGSAHAERAVRQAAKLFPDADAVVLSVWEPIMVTLTHHAAALGHLGPIPAEDADARSRELAEALAAHGAKLAAAAGLRATARSVADVTDTASAIADVADELDARLIVSGSRGLVGARAVLGSVSRRLTTHADRPVLVVPAGDEVDIQRAAADEEAVAA